MICFRVAMSSGRFPVTIVMRALDQIDRVRAGKPWGVDLSQSLLQSGPDQPASCGRHVRRGIRQSMLSSSMPNCAG